MKPLIDGDILRYEVGHGAVTGWGGDDVPSFDYTAELLDTRIANICAMANATEEPTIYFTGDNNFRIQLAKTKVYKGTRPQNKPFHFDNLTAYMKAMYDWKVNDVLEADDLMAIDQTAALAGGVDTIICSRDKDLRMIPGWHYGWEIGRQPSFGPEFVKEIGYLREDDGKVLGVGLSFFYYQMLVGDTVDNIPGCPRVGPKKALKILDGATLPGEMHKAVVEAYDERDLPLEYFEEQANLLWMVRSLDDKGDPIKWSDM